MGNDSISRRGFLGAAAAVGAVAVSAGLVGCGGTSTSQAKPTIMVVSFGTSFNDSRHITIGAIESDIREAFPDYDVIRAFTAQTIIDKLKERDGRSIMNIEEAFQRCVDNGVKELIVQPTHLMAGFEYTDIQKTFDEQKGNFDKAVLGKPLLDSDADYQAVMEAIVEDSQRYDDGETAICLMGHGTEADSNSDYAKMQKMFTDAKYGQYFVTTVEATPSFDETVKAMKDAGFERAVLRPFMVVAGDHANNDMADTSDKGSLAAKCAAAGIRATSVLEGLGQVVGIDEIYVSHVQDSIDSLQ